MKIKEMIQTVAKWISRVISTGPMHRAEKVKAKVSEAAECIRECRKRIEHGC